MLTHLSAVQIKAIRALHNPKGRAQAGAFLAEGVRTVSTMLEAGSTPEKLYVTGEHRNFIGSCKKSFIISQEQMDRISASTTASGVVAIFNIPEEPSPEVFFHVAPFSFKGGLVLARIADPGNMGTLIRSAVAFGYTLVIVVEGCDPYSPKVVQATAGLIAHVTVFRWSWSQVLHYKGEVLLCGLDAHGDSFEQTLPHNLLLVIGNEAHGIPKEWLADCEKKLTIPMDSRVESINAAVAGSIGLFLMRYRRES